MKKVLFAIGAWIAVLAAVAPSVCAQRAPERPSLPNYDKRESLPPDVRLAPPGRVAAEERLKGMMPEARVEVDRFTQAPRFIHSRLGFLSGPAAAGGGISAQTAAAFGPNDPHRAVKAFVTEHRGLFGHGPEALDAAVIKRDYVTPHNGLRTVVWQQQVDGVDVLDAKFIGHITQKGQLVNISSRFVPDPVLAANAGLPNRAAALAALPISAAQAVVNATAGIEEPIALADVQAIDAVPGGPERRQRFNAGPKFKGETDVELKWFALTAGELRPAWQVILAVRHRPDSYLVLIDAQNGEMLRRLALTYYISDATYNVYTSDSPSPFSPGWPTPNTGQPPVVQRQMVTIDALSTNASPNGWINDGDNATQGNNVDAFIDWIDDGQPTIPRPVGNPARTFDFPLDLAQDPTNYASAAVVQLFYWNNWMHDKLYDLGFTEAAGNYQIDNFGRGGLGNDPVVANAQDGAMIGNANNAYFAVQPDGRAGNMAMFVYDGPTPHRDGDLDAEVVLHEYTHGLTWRMVAGGMALGTTQSDSMGEGWSDFYALSLLSEAGDDVNGNYASAGYTGHLLFLGFPGTTPLTENYYFGDRRYPYTTDMSKNPLTFKDIDPDQMDPHAGVPRNPILPSDPSYANEVHFAGEVWCATLWEARANLIAKYGPTNGNQMMLQLVTDALRLSPPEPNYLEERDAIIQADQVNNGGANYVELWQGFMKRGMGGSAFSPESTSTDGIVEAFDPPGLAVDTVTSSDANTGNGNGRIDYDECNELTIVLLNLGFNTASNLTAVLGTTTPGVVVSQPDGTYPNLPRGALGTNLAPYKIYTLPTFVCGTPIDFVLNVRATNDYRTLRFRVNTGLVGSPVRFDNSTSIAIPDGNFTGVESVIDASGFNTAISRVTVSLHVKHTYIYDLTFRLIGPDGTSVILSQNLPWSSDNYGTACSPESSRTTFDDKADVSITRGAPPFAGSYRPLQPLETFVGKSGAAVNGRWRLQAIDSLFGDVGTLECWSLFLSPTVCTEGGGDCATDLSLAMTSAPATAVVGSNLTYTISVANRGPSAARNVMVSDPLPPGVTFVNATASQGVCSFSAGTVECSLGTLQVNRNAIVNVIVAPTAAGFVTNTASIVSTVSDPNPADNSATVVNRVVPPSPLLVPFYSTLVSESLTPANGGLDPGETVTINFKLRNIGSVATTNLIAKLLTTGGVSAPSVQQDYGVVVPFGPAVGREFTFTATGTNGGVVVASLQLQEGTNDLGIVTFPMGLSVVRTFANQGVIRINDNSAATPYPSAINVSGFVGLASRVSVILSNLTHTSANDIDAMMVGPAGQTVMLMSDAGGGSQVNNAVLTLDDGAATPIPAGSLVSGAYRPTDYEPGDSLPLPAAAAPYGSALSIFNGTDPNGTWSLYVADDVGGDDGRIAGGWQLNLSIVDPISPNADLAVAAAAVPNPVGIGSNLTYTVTVTNLGPETAFEVALTNTLPAGVTFVSVTNQSGGVCTVADRQIVCAFDSLTNGGSAAVTIVGTAAVSGSQSFVARVTAGSLVDFNPANNAASVLTTVSASADLAVMLAAQPNPAYVNGALVYSITVSNAGPNNASGVSLTNALPAGVSFVSAVASQGNCTPAGGMVNCALGTLVRNASATVTVQVTTPSAVGVLTNLAGVGAVSPPDPATANNLAMLAVTNLNPNHIIVRAWALLVSESGPITGGIDVGETVTVNLALRNLGLLPTANLMATLAPSGGVNAPSAPQTYGVLDTSGTAVARPFSFTASGTAGGVVVAALHLMDGVTDLGTVQFQFPLGAAAQFASTNVLSIPDRGPALDYPSTIVVSGYAGTVSKVSVTISNLAHSYPDDLDIVLVSPSAQKAVLMSDVGGGVAVTNLTVGFDDFAEASLPNGTVLSSGTFKPTDFEPGDLMPLPAPAGPYPTTLAALAGGDPNGAWSLYVADDTFGDLGVINGGWSLSLATVGSLSPVAPQISQPRIPSKGVFSFTLTGQVGGTYVIQASDDLTTWAAVETVTLIGTTYEYQTPSSSAHQFYRAWRAP